MRKGKENSQTDGQQDDTLRFLDELNERAEEFLFVSRVVVAKADLAIHHGKKLLKGIEARDNENRELADTILANIDQIKDRLKRP
jgi:hypothetical protein